MLCKIRTYICQKPISHHKNVILSALTIALQESFSLLPTVSQAVMVEGAILHKTTLTPDTNYKFEGLPKALSISITHDKDSQNPLKAIILTVATYYRERL